MLILQHSFYRGYFARQCWTIFCNCVEAPEETPCAPARGVCTPSIFCNFRPDCEQLLTGESSVPLDRVRTVEIPWEHCRDRIHLGNACGGRFLPNECTKFFPINSWSIFLFFFLLFIYYYFFFFRSSFLRHSASANCRRTTRELRFLQWHGQVFGGNSSKLNQCHLFFKAVQ